MNFKYTALGSNNQKLEGLLESVNLDEAREQLHKMGLSIVAIVPVIETPKVTKTPLGITTYCFLATNPEQKEINGTIDAKDPYSAYKRLVTEYQFNVLDLYPEKFSQESFNNEFTEWRNKIESEGLDLTKKSSIGIKNVELEETEKMNEIIESETDHFIINTKKILNSKSQMYSEATLREIEKTLNELERIRSSNNLKHITRVCNDLFELVSTPDLVTDNNQMEAVGAGPNPLLELQESGFIANRFQFLEAQKLQKKIAHFEQIKKFFSKVNQMLNLKESPPSSPSGDSFITAVIKSLKGERNKQTPTFKMVVYKFFDYLSASSTILRRAKKHDLLRTYQEWKQYRNQLRSSIKKHRPTQIIPAVSKTKSDKYDFTAFFLELDNFFGWLLFFYIAYFFVVSFSLEKGVGLSKEMILKTLSSPLLINISILLLMFHLALRIKITVFQKNLIGSLFLFFLTLGLYSILVLNF